MAKRGGGRGKGRGEGEGEGGRGGRGRGIKFQTPYQKMRKYPRTQIAEPDEIIYIVERKL
jgi:hypothetical protein